MKKVAPAVARIVTVLSIDSLAEVGRDDPSSRCFGGQIPREYFGSPLLHGLGSGVIVTEGGYGDRLSLRPVSALGPEDRNTLATTQLQQSPPSGTGSAEVRAVHRRQEHGY